MAERLLARLTGLGATVPPALTGNLVRAGGGGSAGDVSRQPGAAVDAVGDISSGAGA